MLGVIAGQHARNRYHLSCSKNLMYLKMYMGKALSLYVMIGPLVATHVHLQSLLPLTLKQHRYIALPLHMP